MNVDLTASLLADVLRERGPTPCSTLALLVRRRKADVRAILGSHPWFERRGRTRGAFWELKDTTEPVPFGPVAAIVASDAHTGTYTIGDFARRWGCSKASAEEIISGAEGFVEKDLIERVGGERYRVTSAGRDLSMELRGWSLAGTGMELAA